jgi:hypothetical protein
LVEAAEPFGVSSSRRNENWSCAYGGKELHEEGIFFFFHGSL